jgi:hypothetical protein
MIQFKIPIEFILVTLVRADPSGCTVCGRSLTGIADSIPTGGMNVCVSCECSVSSDRDLYVRLITCPEEYYQVWCV